MWPLVVVCAVAIPATVLCVLSRSQRLSFPRGCVVWPHWLSDKSRSHGCRARSGPTGFWQKQSQSVAEKSGRANSVRSRMFGRDDAGDVIITSRRACMGSFSRRSQQRESGLQARRARVVRKREKLQAWKPRIKSLEHELMPRERMKECEIGQASPLKKKGTWKKYGETVWKSRRRMTKKIGRKEKNTEKATRGRETVLCFKGNVGDPHGVNATSAARGGEKVERSHSWASTGAKEVTKDTKHPRQENKFTEGKLGGKRRNAENQRRNWVEGRALHTAVGLRQKTQRKMRKWKQNFRDCRLEKKEEVAMHRKRLNECCRVNGGTDFRHGSGSGEVKVRCSVPKDPQTPSPPAQMPGMPGREEGRRDSENEQEQGRASQQLASVTPGGIDKVAPASSSELDLPRVWGVPGGGGSAGRPCKRGPSRSPGRPSRDEEGDDDFGDLVP